MEHDIKKFGDNEKNLIYFKLQYEGQNVEKIQEFQKWYNTTNISITNENIKRRNEYLKQKKDIYKSDYAQTELLLISFCPYCCSYSVCSYYDGFCFIKCQNCRAEFCAGCYKKSINDQDISICFKGYIKLYYFRMVYGRSDIYEGKIYFYIIHILVCLFLTPFLFGLISSFMGQVYHKSYKRENETKNVINKNNENEQILENNNDNIQDDSKEQIKIYIILIYSFFRGLLMFPYIIIIFPFMIIVLLPGIFSRKYYLIIFIMYLTSILPGHEFLDNYIIT